MIDRYNMLRLLGFAFPALAISFHAAAESSPPLVLGSYAYPGLDRVAALKPLAKVVAKETDKQVEIRLYDNPDKLAAAIKAAEVDVAVANLGAWLSVANEPAVEPLAVVVPPERVRSRYRALLLVRHDLRVTNLVDIGAGANGWRFAAVMPGSVSGGMVQNKALVEANRAEPQWSSVSFFGSHEGALEALAKGKADVAAVAEMPWVAWQSAQTGKPGSENLPRVLWRSSPLPAGTLACRASPRLDCSALAKALLRSTNETRRTALHLGQGWPEWARARRFAAYDAEANARLGLTTPVPKPQQ